MGFLHMYRLHDVDTARREALLARANADAFLGDLESMAGRYRPALTYLLSGQQHAEESGHDPVVLSRIYSYLGVVNVKLGEYDTAINYLDLAIEYDRKVGDEVGPLYDLMNRSAAHTLTGRFEQGAADARNGLEVAKRLRHVYLISGLAACLAEACCGLTDWDAAESYAQQSLGQEEPFFRASSLRVLGTAQLERGQGTAAVELFQARSTVFSKLRTLTPRPKSGIIWLAPTCGKVQWSWPGRRWRRRSACIRGWSWRAKPLSFSPGSRASPPLTERGDAGQTGARH
jgi:tetratricopeptide (TPR) repeat protein